MAHTIDQNTASFGNRGQLDGYLQNAVVERGFDFLGIKGGRKLDFTLEAHILNP